MRPPLRNRKATSSSVRRSFGRPWWVGAASGGQRSAGRPSASRRRGPLTPADAERELKSALGRGSAGIFFAFARQYFEYTRSSWCTAIWRGHEAWGRAPVDERVRAIGVALRTCRARSRKRAICAAPLHPHDGPRARRRPARISPGSARVDVLIMPIAVRKRSVALSLGDEGTRRSRSARSATCSRSRGCGEALERIVRQKKRSAHRDGGAPPPRGGASPPPAAAAPTAPRRERCMEAGRGGRRCEASPHDAPEITYADTRGPFALGQVAKWMRVRTCTWATRRFGRGPLEPKRRPAEPPSARGAHFGEPGVGSARFSVERTRAGFACAPSAAPHRAHSLGPGRSSDRGWRRG